MASPGTDSSVRLTPRRQFAGHPASPNPLDAPSPAQHRSDRRPADRSAALPVHPPGAAAVIDDLIVQLRRWRWLLVPLAVCVALPFLARAVAFRMVESNSLVSRPVGPETPMDFGVPFTRVNIPRGSYRLDGVMTKFSDRAPVIVIFHGSAESVSYWADVQALLYKAGISSYVFDYSGFGNSGGERHAARSSRKMSARPGVTPRSSSPSPNAASRSATRLARASS